MLGGVEKIWVKAPDSRAEIRDTIVQQRNHLLKQIGSLIGCIRQVDFHKLAGLSKGHGIKRTLSTWSSLAWDPVICRKVVQLSRRRHVFFISNVAFFAGQVALFWWELPCCPRWGPQLARRLPLSFHFAVWGREGLTRNCRSTPAEQSMALSLRSIKHLIGCVKSTPPVQLPFPCGGLARALFWPGLMTRPFGKDLRGNSARYLQLKYPILAIKLMSRKAMMCSRKLLNMSVLCFVVS